MGDLVPVGTGTAVVSGDGAGFHGLQADLEKLVGDAEQLKERAALLARATGENADLARITAEQTAQAQAAPRHVAQVQEVASALVAAAAGAKALATRADAMAAQARAVKEAHNAEYRGVYEAVQASGIPMAKPGFYRLR